MKQYPNAANGLKLMFYGEILTIIAPLFLLVPWVGTILILIGGVLSLVGLNQAGSDDAGYRTAFVLTIVNLVLSIVVLFVGDGFLATLIGLCSSVLSLLIVYYVCITTANLLHSIGEENLSSRGRTVWMINLICTVVGVVISLLMYIPILNVLAMAASIIMVIVQLIGYILYLMFLYGSCKVL